MSFHFRRVFPLICERVGIIESIPSVLPSQRSESLSMFKYWLCKGVEGEGGKSGWCRVFLLLRRVTEFASVEKKYFEKCFCYVLRVKKFATSTKFFLIWHCNNPWTLQWQIFPFLLNVGKYWTSRLWDWVDRNDRMERVISIGQVQQKKVHFERWTTFFRNFSGWTEPIHLILDRNVRKFWLNGSCSLFQFRVSCVDCSFPL